MSRFFETLTPEAMQSFVKHTFIHFEENIENRKIASFDLSTMCDRLDDLDAASEVDCSATPSSPSPQWNIKNTFVHVVDDEDACEVPVRKIQSCGLMELTHKLTTSTGRWSNFSTCSDVAEEDELLTHSPSSSSPQSICLEEQSDDETEDLSQAELGPPPSIGSLDHAQGTCKPCVFIWNPKKGGCVNAENCTFCHYKHPPKKRVKSLKKRMERAEARKEFFQKLRQERKDRRRAAREEREAADTEAAMTQAADEHTEAEPEVLAC